MRDTIISDVIEFQGVLFDVKVRKIDKYIHAGSGEIRGVNTNGAPCGLQRGGRKWVRCKCIESRIRPAYGESPTVTGDGDWLKHVDRHHRAVEPLEVPNREWLLFFGTEDRSRQRTDGELVEDAISKLKDAYEEQVPDDLDGRGYDVATLET